MDFRTVDPAAIQWATGPRGLPVARTPAGRVTVQTPLCACRPSLASAGMYRLELFFLPHVAQHAAFCQWMADVEDAAADKLRFPDKVRSACVYNNGMRLMAFSDTLAFDASGKLSADLLDAASCSCIIELQGCWTSEYKWGLRWKIVQLKFGAEAPAFPPAPTTGDDDVPARPAGEAFAFLED